MSGAPGGLVLALALALTALTTLAALVGPVRLTASISSSPATSTTPSPVILASAADCSHLRLILGCEGGQGFVHGGVGESCHVQLL